jgi:hypothetical protein
MSTLAGNMLLKAPSLRPDMYLAFNRRKAEKAKNPAMAQRIMNLRRDILK